MKRSTSFIHNYYYLYNNNHRMKNRKKLKRSLFQRLFQRKLVVHTTSANALQVIQVDPDLDDLTGTLGIDQLRQEELGKIVLKEYRNTDDVVTAMVNISKECKHANELFYCSWIVKELREMHANPIAALLRGMK